MSNKNMTEKTIKKLNDEFRHEFWCSSLGITFITRGVSALSAKERSELMDRVRSFNEFNENNDPYGEHDFGCIEISGKTFFWKIDYYDNNFEYGSENPADPKITKRVLTIMLATEY